MDKKLKLIVYDFKSSLAVSRHDRESYQKISERILNPKDFVFIYGNRENSLVRLPDNVLQKYHNVISRFSQCGISEMERKFYGKINLSFADGFAGVFFAPHDDLSKLDSIRYVNLGTRIPNISGSDKDRDLKLRSLGHGSAIDFGFPDSLIFDNYSASLLKD